MKRILATILLLCLCAMAQAGLAAERTLWAYQGNAAFYVQDGKIGLLHKSGSRTLMAPILNEARPFINDLACVRDRQLWGLLDKMGRWVFRAASVTPIDFGPDGEHGLYSPEPGLWGFINRKGQTVLEPAPYAFAGVMSQGLFAASQGQGYGYVDWNGKAVIDFQFEEALPFSEDLAAVQKDGLWGYINKSGETVLPFAYTEAGSFVKGLAPVALGQGSPTVYINPTGKTVLEGAWEWGGDFTADKLARVRVDGHYGYISQKGRLTIPARYSNAHDFGDGCAPVQANDGSWVYLNTKGKIISKQYVAAGPYQSGFAFVTYTNPDTGETVSGYINKNRFFVSQAVE